jgi:hypothetical protein
VAASYGACLDGLTTPGEGRPSKWHHRKPADTLFPAQESHLCADVLNALFQAFATALERGPVLAAHASVTVMRIGSVLRRS